MRIKGLCAAILIVAATPAVAQHRPEPAIVTEGNAGAQLRAYGNWIEQLSVAFRIGQNAVEPLQAKLGAVLTSQGSPASMAEARTAIANARVALRKSSALLNALDTPTLALLHLPPELDVPAMRAGALALNGNRIKMLDGVDRFLTAIEKRDLQAVRRANGELLGAGHQQLDMLILLSKARIVAAGDQVSDRTFFELLTLIYRSQRRLLGLISPTGVVADLRLAGDLETIASETETLMARERALLEESIAETREQGAEARARGEDGSAYERLYRVRVNGRELFPRGDELAKLLRETATMMRQRLPTPIEFGAQVRRFTEIEKALADIQMRSIQTIKGGTLS